MSDMFTDAHGRGNRYTDATIPGMSCSTCAYYRNPAVGVQCNLYPMRVVIEDGFCNAYRPGSDPETEQLTDELIEEAPESLDVDLHCNCLEVLRYRVKSIDDDSIRDAWKCKVCGAEFARIQSELPVGVVAICTKCKHCNKEGTSNGVGWTCKGVGPTTVFSHVTGETEIHDTFCSVHNCDGKCREYDPEGIPDDDIRTLELD